MKKVMLTTGGTGGHIYPALAVADKLKLKGVDTVFVGSTERMEKDLVPDSGHKFIGIDISVPRGWKNIRKYLKAIKVAFKVIKEVYLIGVIADKIESELKKVGYEDSRIHKLVNLENSLQDMKKRFTKDSDEVILLSPATSSYDQFNSFEHRGKVFKELVLKIFG